MAQEQTVKPESRDDRIMGRPSQGRESRIQAQVTPELAQWIRAQKTYEGESISDVIFRLLDGMRKTNE